MKRIGIVTENNVHSALEYLAQHPHPWALARYEHTKAENEYERIWAAVYGEQEGSIKDKESGTDRDPRVCAARECVAKAQLDMDTHRQRIDAARSLLDIFQTESANTRSCEKIR